MIKLLNQINEAFLITFTAVSLISCGKESSQKNFVARVNDSYLTSEELSSMIDTNKTNNFYKNEIIRNWINKEILYQTAVKEGILKEDNFKSVIEDSKKELAASFLIKKLYEDEKVSFSLDDLENYYNQHTNEFARFHDSYLINKIAFSDEDRAVQFRSIVLESNWENALNVIKGDTSIKEIRTNQLLYDYEIHPVTLLRVVTDLNPDEISIVIKDEKGNFTVVQEVQQFKKGTIPPFEVIKPEVENRFVADKKENLIKNYIKELYSNNDIEVRN